VPFRPREQSVAWESATHDDKRVTIRGDAYGLSREDDGPTSAGHMPLYTGIRTQTKIACPKMASPPATARMARNTSS
jgi:hypothetical protein